MDTSRIAPELLRATVKIESRSLLPGDSAIGSGFMVSAQLNDTQRLMFLVTNKHVLGDWSLADGDVQRYYHSLILNCYGHNPGEIVPVRVDLTDANGQLLPLRVLLYPDPTVDVAVVSLPGDLLSANTVFHTSFDLSYLLSFDRITAHLTGLGDQVFALGYPRGITSVTTSHPIAKAGYLSTAPGQTFAIDITGQNRMGVLLRRRVEGKILIVDGLIVPGNSGGPIILPADLRIRRNPQTNAFEMADQHLKNFVIGIVSMGLNNSGLTLVFASDYVTELVQQFVQQLRAAHHL